MSIHSRINRARAIPNPEAQAEVPGVAEFRVICENARRVVAACALVEPNVDLEIPVAHLSDDDDEPYFWDFD